MRGVIGLIGAIVGYYLAKDKYVFQKLYDRKLVLMADLYEQVVRLEFELKKYVHFVGAETSTDSPENKREALNKIKADFQKFQHKFWEVEIILDENVIKKIEEFLAQYIQITSKLSTANISQQIGDSGYSFDAWNQSFELVRSNLAKVKTELKQEFQNTLKK